MTTYTVAELARVIGRAIARTLPEEVWVQGEIRDLSRAASGHVYFTLVDPDTADTPAAILPVTLFATDKMAVNRVLQRSGAVRMTDGVEIRIRGQVSHYAARGTVQLRMTWIDTDFTLGRLAAERERLIRSLEARGLLEKNRSLPLAAVPLRIGLITSAGSAAEADFVHELELSGFAWKVRLYPVRVQGAEAVPDIVSGLTTLGRQEVDAIALVRGGGAQTDLAVFDHESIAIAIANTPVPVLTGIGHEIDVSVADLVARSQKTPTACAAALVAQVQVFVDRLDRIARDTRRTVRARLAGAEVGLGHSTARLQRAGGLVGNRSHAHLSALEERVGRASRIELQRSEERLRSLGSRIGRMGGVHLDGAAAAVDRMAAMVTTTATRGVQTGRVLLSELEHRLDLSDPERLLARGWSITRTEQGELVTDPNQVATGSVLETRVSGGQVRSVVAEEATDV